MKADEHTGDAQNRVNPFVKLANDMERIANAVKNGQPLSSLTDIKFIKPFDWSDDEEFVAELDERVRRYEADIDPGFSIEEAKSSLQEMKKEHLKTLGK